MSGLVAATAGVHRKKGALFSLERMLHVAVVVSCVDDVEYRGLLKGFDSNMNLVLAETEELRHTPEGLPCRRSLGAAIVRGGCVVSVAPAAGRKQIPNPF